MKTCSKCREVLPVACFGVRRLSRDGLQKWCRKCRALDQAFRPGMSHIGGETGTLLEVLAEAWWMERGYTTSRPTHGGAPYDLVLDDGKRLVRCEVKVKSQRRQAKLGTQCDVLTTVDPLRKIEVFWADGMQPEGWTT